MSSFRFLIVDDDPDLGAIVAQKLESLGGCTLCASGHAAIALLDKEAFDVVVTDYIMEGGSGGSLAHYCKNKKIPVLVVSSFPEPQIRPYLPHGTSFLNKLLAVRGNHLKEQIQTLIMAPKR